MDQAAQIQLFWAKVLNGTPKYCTPYNTAPLVDVGLASDYLWLQEVTAILPMPFMIVGILTNLLFLLACIRSKAMRNTINVYLGNLAVVDILYLIIVGSVYIDRKYTKPAIYHESLPGCYFLSAADAVGYYGALILITMALVYHLCVQASAGFANGKIGTAASTIATWVIAIAFGALAAIQWGSELMVCFVWPKLPIKTIFDTLPTVSTKCGPGPIKDANYEVYLDLVKTVVFFTFFLVNIILYVLICRSKSPENVNQSMKQQMSRLLICNGIFFFVCHSVNRVLNIFNTKTTFSGKSILEADVKVLLELFGNGLVYLNSAIRPLIYAACSGAYRSGYWTAITGQGGDNDDQVEKNHKPTSN